MEYSPLYRQAARRVEADLGPPRVQRQTDPGYYSKRVMAAVAVLNAIDAVTDLEEIGPPMGIAPRLAAAVGPRLGQAVRGMMPLPLPLDTVEGWVAFVRAGRHCIEAIDADDAEAPAWNAGYASEPLPVNSPYLNAEESAAYLRLPSVKALYRLVERVCRGKRQRRKYKFTRDQLDTLQCGKNPWK